MGLFDSIVASANKAKKEEQKNIQGKSNYELERLYRYYLDEYSSSHWKAELIREEMAARGMTIPR